MDVDWPAVVAAIRSGESDQVNDAIDRIKDLDPEQRIDLFDHGFDDLAEIYTTNEDGYVRQSVVRVVETLTPGMVTATLIDDPERDSDEIEQLETRIDIACGFLLEALQDEDGRVRQSAKRGLKEVYRSYRVLEDTDTIAALIAELESLAEDYEDKRREHLLDSKADAEYMLSPIGAGLVESIEGLAARSDEW